MNKEKYIEYAKKTFQGKALELVLNNIELFYKNEKIEKNKYQVGEEVKLKKGTYMHGISGLLDNFDWIVENGFISNDFTEENIHNKIRHSIGMWVIQKDCLLQDYIKEYSGFTITYTIGRGPGSKEVTKLIPYHKFDEAKEMIKKDIWNIELVEEELKDFLDYRYYENFLKERVNRTAQTTDRESAIMFGLPATLIEGVLVGRKLEQDKDSLKHIKEKLPDCYICNIDGKIISGNK